jgi:hypothetical protein
MLRQDGHADGFDDRVDLLRSFPWCEGSIRYGKADVRNDLLVAILKNDDRSGVESSQIFEKGFASVITSIEDPGTHRVPVNLAGRQTGALKHPCITAEDETTVLETIKEGSDAQDVGDKTEATLFRFFYDDHEIAKELLKTLVAPLRKY